MPGFDRQDRASSGQENRVRKEDGTTEVGSDTDVLNDTSSGGHGGDIGERTVELELAVGDGCSTERLKSSLWV